MDCMRETIELIIIGLPALCAEVDTGSFTNELDR